MTELRISMRLTKEGKQEQQKFFRLCCAEDKNKLTGKADMSAEDFARITYLLRWLGLSKYESYVNLRFQKQLCTYIDMQAWLDDGDYSDGDWKDEETLEKAEQWIRKFCEQIPAERTRKEYIKKYIEDGKWNEEI